MKSISTVKLARASTRFFSPFITHEHAACHSHSVHGLPDFLKKGVNITEEKKSPSCTNCAYFVKNSRLCARFYLYANYCRYDDRKCGYTARFWTEIRD